MANKPHLASEDNLENNLEDNVPYALLASETAPLSRLHLARKHSHSSDTSLKDTHKDKQIVSEDKAAMLAVEAAVAIVINGIHYAILMASPYQLEYLAIGFLYSEGLIQNSHELLDWEVTQLASVENYQDSMQSSYNQNNSTQDTFIHNISDEPISMSQLSEQLQDYDVYVVNLVLNQRCHQRIQAQRRQLAGRTGCGMCGITGLTQALPDLSDYVKNEQPLTAAIPSLDKLLNLRAQINAAQHTHQLTGAVHAAATLHEQQLYLFEDVGRHNALDKLIGWQVRHKAQVDCVLMTSRLSIELVQKSIRSNIPWLIGMSAPTSTAVRVAERYGLGLAGFLRDNRVTYYTGIN